MTIRQSIVMLPQFATWDDWNGDLLHYYGEEPIPVVKEDDWREVAFCLINLPTFVNFAIPGPGEFDHWQEWVRELIVAVNGPTI